MHKRHNDTIMNPALTVEPVPTDQALNLESVPCLVAYAMRAAYLGKDPHAAAAALLSSKSPTAAELSAARKQNHEVHGGTSADITYPGQPSPTPETVELIRDLINDILSAAERKLESTQ